MVGWYRRLNGHEFEPTLEDGEEQEAWRAAGHGVTKSHMSEELNNNRLLYNVVLILPYNKVNQP